MGLPLPLLNIRRRLAGGISPAALFLNSEPGVWYDPSDLTTMFQDRAGTTLVTTPGQSVGLVLDKRLGLTPGPELVTNGTFDTDTAWTKETGWIISGGVASISGGGASVRIYQSFASKVGAFYEVSYTVISHGGTGFSVFFGTAGPPTSAGVFRNAAGTFKEYIVAGGTTLFVGVGTRGVGPTSLTIDNISVREIPGNHMVATADASRGTYGIEPFGGRRNLLTFTEQFENAVWGKAPPASAFITANAGESPIGDMTADLLTILTAGELQFNTGLPLTDNTFSIYVKAPDSGAAVAIRLSTNDGNAWNTGISEKFTLTSEWQRISISGDLLPNSAGNCRIVIGCKTVGGGNDLDCLGDILIWGAQLELGSTATPYQRVTTAFDVTEDGVPTVHYVQFDGADDGYLTSTITPGTDKAQVFAGVRKLLTSGFGLVAEFGTDVSTTNGSSALFGPFGASNDYGFFSRGTALQSAQVDGFETPITNVLTGLGDISGDRATLRINGTQVAQSTADQGTGNYLAYPLYIGRRGGTTLPFNGRLYQMVVRFGPNLDAARIAQVERFINSKTGAY